MNNVTAISTASIEDAEEAITHESDSDSTTLKEAAQLSELEYERNRSEIAVGMGIRASILDKLVKVERQEQEINSSEIVTEDNVCPDPVNASLIANEIHRIVSHHLMLPAGGAVAITLWIMNTYTYNRFGICPKLLLNSPEKRCGKTTALEVVDALSCKALTSSNISPAAIFRTVNLCSPTLIIDEADTFVAGRNDDLIGIINSGHRKTGAHVIRCEGDNHEPKKYSTWAPMAIAAIKQIQGTVTDRSVVIPLRRKTQSEKVARIPFNFKENCTIHREMLMRWAQDFIPQEVEPPSISNDRAMDNWRPLFSIAKDIGGEWHTRINDAFHCLNQTEDEDTPTIMLLNDIRELTVGVSAIPSSVLVTKLVNMEERPWCEWRKGKPMTQNTLAKMLKGFGIYSQNIRVSGRVIKGYKITQFMDTFERYLPTSSV